MAPEQILNFRAVQPPADQYAAAATLYYLLTGRSIHDLPAGAEGQIRMLLQKDPVPIRQRRDSLPDGLASVIHKALAREPGARYADVGVLREALVPFES
jgi:serine/threonine-protein kinase